MPGIQLVIELPEQIELVEADFCKGLAVQVKLPVANGEYIVLGEGRCGDGGRLGRSAEMSAARCEDCRGDKCQCAGRG